MVVRSVLPNGASGRSGLIHEGDTILSLDGIDMRGKVTCFCLQVLFSSSSLHPNEFLFGKNTLTLPVSHL
jgi:hypothetical protein